MTSRDANIRMVPPKYILMPAVGIDMSDRSIKYAELLPRKHGTRLGRFGEVHLAPGIVENGKIINRDQLVEVLKHIRERQDITFVRTAIPEEQVYYFRTRLPDGDMETLRETIELSLEEHVPISASDAIFDFRVLSRTVSGDAEVAVTAAPRAIIDMYTDVFNAAGMTLLSVELEAEALARTLVHPEDASTHLIVDFGELRTGIAIVSNGDIQFTSTVTIGGRMLTETLAKHFNVSEDEAEGMKKEMGLKRNTSDEELFGLLLNNVAVLRDEINKNFTYWHTHPDEHGKTRPIIESIFLVGGDANLAGLSDYLTSSLRVKTTVADVWVNAGLPEGEIPEISRTASLGYATAIGLALRTTDHE